MVSCSSRSSIRHVELSGRAMMCTSLSSLTRRRTKCEPTNPVPPVTSTRLFLMLTAPAIAHRSPELVLVDRQDKICSTSSAAGRNFFFCSLRKIGAAALHQLSICHLRQKISHERAAHIQWPKTDLQGLLRYCQRARLLRLAHRVLEATTEDTAKNGGINFKFLHNEYPEPHVEKYECSGKGQSGPDRAPNWSKHYTHQHVDNSAEDRHFCSDQLMTRHIEQICYRTSDDVCQLSQC